MQHTRYHTHTHCKERIGGSALWARQPDEAGTAHGRRGMAGAVNGGEEDARGWRARPAGSTGGDGAQGR